MSTASDGFKKVPLLLLFILNLGLTFVDVYYKDKSLSEAKQSISNGIIISDSDDCPPASSFCYDPLSVCGSKNFSGNTSYYIVSANASKALMIWNVSFYVFSTYYLLYETALCLVFLFFSCCTRIPCRKSGNQDSTKKCIKFFFTPMPIICHMASFILQKQIFSTVWCT